MSNKKSRRTIFYKPTSDKSKVKYEEKAIELIEEALDYSQFENLIGISIVITNSIRQNEGIKINIPYNTPFCTKKISNRLIDEFSKGSKYIGMIQIYHPDSEIVSVASISKENNETENNIIKKLSDTISPSREFENYPYKSCMTDKHCYN